jgi:glutamate-ammonia-ligase adenylyltransferase
MDLRDLELLRIGVRDLQRRSNARQTARELTRAADHSVRLATAATGARLARRHGAPPGGRFAVLALGRLGAEEMAYGSDLDLLFLWEGDAPCPDGTDAATYGARWARDLVALLGGPGERGPVHRVDLRLRPDGRKGDLTASPAGFARYQRERAETWERQALVRARTVAGDASLQTEVAALLDDLLYGAPPRGDILAEVRAMRLRVEEGGTPGSLKTGTGGVQDAEFLAQALLLRHGHEHPAVRHTNTVAALGALRQEGLLGADAHDGITAAYLFLRGVEMRIRLASDASGSVFPADPAARDDLARRLGYVTTQYASPGASLAEEVAYYRNRLRTWFDRVMDGNLSR